MKNIIIVGALGVLLVGGWFAYTNTDFFSMNTPEKEAKNVEMMKVDTGTPITVTADLEYFPGAKGYFARPESEGQYPGIVMVHENRGLRPEIKEAADALARQGYMVLAVDLLGGVAEDQDGAKALTANFKQEVGTENMRKAAAYLRDNGAEKMASLRWCFGGKQSLELALSGEKLDATVVYYGGGMATSTDRLKAISWPVLGVFGEEDRVIPMKMVDDFKASLNTLGIQNEVYVYPGVGHAFANPSGANYAPTETMDAWNKTLAFLESHLK
ncbi:dienelactone hydrolase family protein [Patescibacteria group bacterium]|nr:dienelactone hydrolase family protein [Patescibacteria group bacterium]